MVKKKWYELLNQEASASSIWGLISQTVLLVRSKFYTLTFFLVIGGLGGLIMSYFKPAKYRAEIVFAAEEEGVSGFEGLMAQFGLDVGGSNPGGVFQGEGLVKVFQTRQMLERALLQRAEIDGDTVLLANYLFKTTRYANESVFKDVQINHDRTKQNRLADSALFLLQKHLRNKLLSVNKPDKRQSIILLNVEHTNPAFAKAMAQTLLNQVSDFYIEILTKKARNNLRILQAEADSTRGLITNNLTSNAAELDLNVNPLRQSLRVNQSKKMIDLQVSVALYGEIVKNLKLAEISLRKQTPLIQVIDTPVMPLERTGFTWVGWLFIGMFLGFLFFLFHIYSRSEVK